MPLILSQKESYTWPVKYITQKDGGTYDKFEFLAEFKRLPQSRYDQLLTQIRSPEVGNLVTDDDLIREVFMSWSGIKKLDGQDFEVSDLNRRVLLEYQGMRAAILTAWWESMSGAAIKN